MNPNLQPANPGNPDPHPDAESLNAFREQALSQRERLQVLAHLAVCGRCRQIVALAQEAAEAEAAPQLTASAPRRPWFRNWRIASIPVAALACLITMAVVLNLRRAPLPTETVPTALSGPAAQPVPVVPPAPTAASHPAPQPKRRQPAARPPSPQTLAEAAFSSQPAQVPVKPAPAPSAFADAARKKQPPALFATEAAAWRQQQATVNAQQKAALAENEQRTWSNAAAAAPNGSLALHEEAFGSAGLASPAMRAPIAPHPSPLPSGLPSVSSARIGRQMVAVDSAGGVFLSGDGGEHWEPVLRQWTGRATSVRTQPFSAAENGRQSPPLFRLQNDAGKEWTSSDGRTWTAYATAPAETPH